MNLKLFFIVLSISHLAAAQNAKCIAQDTCEKCLVADEACAWCTDRRYNLKKPRCMTSSELLAANCGLDFIYRNKYESVSILTNEQIRDFSTNGERKRAIQIQPQKVKFTLAKNQKQTIKMTYKPAKNYPLDLYYLMDLTWTMRDDRETLVLNAYSIAKSLSTLTENYRLGFGSFADKTKMPMVMPGDTYTKNPCAPVHEKCEPAYGFRHKVNLTTQIENFIQRVNSSEITANLDNIEGGLDALMQVLVCKEAIGWGEQTRKVVIFATDSKMHFSGFGKLAGVIKKNDKKCHLDNFGEYSATNQLDYPSLEEIYRVLVKSKINVIFAVTRDYVGHYDLLHQELKEMSRVGILEIDSSNIIQLIEQGYTEFVKRVQFFDNAPPHLKVEYLTDCGGLYKEKHSQNRCDNIEMGKSYDFDVEITAMDFPEDGEKTHTIRIEETSLSEGMDIEVEVRSPCGCLEEEKPEINSALCSFHGYYQCGMCFCDDGRGGKQCECDMMDLSSEKHMEMNCKEPKTDPKTNITTYGTMCSESGSCFCGQCYCHKGRSGQYCECPDCPIYNGYECGGPDHAFCDCGECVCANGWSGPKCDCSPSKESCFPPNSTKICSGFGVCKCGKCKCDFGHMGSFCESSTGQESALCQYYEPCVRCLIDRTTNATNTCDKMTDVCRGDNGREFDYKLKDDLGSEALLCVVRMRKSGKDSSKIEGAEDSKDICEHYFTYDVDETGHSLLNIKKTDCSETNYAYLSGFLILATLVGGILIFAIVKMIFVVQDRRIMAEFHKHERETKYVEMSPLYVSPVTTYELPEEYRRSQKVESFTYHEDTKEYFT